VGVPTFDDKNLSISLLSDEFGMNRWFKAVRKGIGAVVGT
jgi:hypothetical protein